MYINQYNMPYVRKTYRRKPYQRKRKTTRKPKTKAALAKRAIRKSVILYNPSVSMFKPTQTFNLTYRHRSRWTMNSGSTSAFSFRLNSIFDLDYQNNLGNKQPMFYDQLVATGMYPYYTVDNVVFKVTVYNLTESGQKQIDNALGTLTGGSLYSNTGRVELTMPPIKLSLGNPANMDTYDKAILLPGTTQRGSSEVGKDISSIQSLDVKKRLKDLGLDHNATAIGSNPANSIYYYFFLGDQELPYFANGDTITTGIDIEVIQTVKMSRLAPVES